MNRGAMFFNSQVAATIYDNALMVMSLRKMFPNWTRSIGQLRRSSDDAYAYFFFRRFWSSFFNEPHIYDKFRHARCDNSGNLGRFRQLLCQTMVLAKRR